MNSKNKKLRNTRQRKYMLELLRGTTTHPNAFWLHEQMKPAFPNLSLSTVYRNLGILESQGLIQRLSCDSSSDRYDGNIAMHSHFYCRKCNSVYDIDADAVEQSAMQNQNADIGRLDACQITFYGICNKCLNKTNQERKD